MVASVAARAPGWLWMCLAGTRGGSLVKADQREKKNNFAKKLKMRKNGKIE